MTESTAPEPEPAQEQPVPDVVIDVDLDLDTVLAQAPGTGVSVGELLGLLDVGSPARTFQEPAAAIGAPDLGWALPRGLYQEMAGLKDAFSTARLLGSAFDGVKAAMAAPMLGLSNHLATAFTPADLLGDAFGLTDVQTALMKPLVETGTLGGSFLPDAVLGDAFRLDDIQLVLAKPLLDLGDLWVKTFEFHQISTVLGSFSDVWTSTLFDQVHLWMEDVESGPSQARAWARRALAAVRRARRAAREGRPREVEQFIEIYLADEVKAYLVQVGRYERGVAAGFDYRRREAVTAVAMALLALPPLPADGEADAQAVLAELRGELRRQQRDFRPTFRRMHRGQFVGTFADLPASSANQLAEIDPIPGEYADDRLGHVAGMLEPAELAVIETYAVNLGTMTWNEAAVAAGYSEAFGSHVRRKRKTLLPELARRTAAQAHTKARPARQPLDG